MIDTMKMDECLDILAHNYIGRLGYIFGPRPYVLPITYYHDQEEKSIISYAAEGHKLEAMRRHPEVALQVDDIRSVQDWNSVMVHGTFEELKGPTAKYYLHRFADGVKNAFESQGKQVPQFIRDFSSKMDTRGLPIVYRIRIDEISGKTRDN